MKTYTVVRDTWEKEAQGWFFSKTNRCDGTVCRHLKTGDYSIDGLEETITIERKGSVKEFVTNLHEARFVKQLERMAEFPVAVVILEFEFDQLARWPDSCPIRVENLPAYLRRPGCGLAAFWKMRLRFPTVEFLFAGKFGREAASSLFKRVVEQYG
jgi:hypothetical protein